MSEVLYRSISNWLSEPGRKQIDITNNTGVSKSLISLVLDKKGQKDLQFSKALSIIRYIEDDYLEVMDDYCRGLTKPMGVLNSLEYASNFGRKDLLDDLIADYSDHRGEVKEWVEIYKFERDRQMMKPEQAWEKCRELYGRVSLLDAKIKIELIESAIQFRDNEYNLKSFINRVENKFSYLRDGFFKDTLQVRYHLHVALVSLYEDVNIDKAVEHATKVIKSWLAHPFLIASAYHVLGHTEMYKSAAKSVEYLEKARRFYKLADSPKHKDIDQDIHFVNNLHGIKMDLDSMDQEETAHQLYVRGEVGRAVKILDSIKDKTAYGYLYTALCKNDAAALFTGYGMIKRSGNNFFSLLYEEKMKTMLNAERG